jgi:hypothetical protein
VFTVCEPIPVLYLVYLAAMRSSNKEGVLPRGVKLGMKYPISYRDTDDIHATLQYVFKPVSVAQQQNGTIQLDSKGKVDLRIVGDGGVEESFAGTKHERGVSGKDYECILVMEGESFKLQRVDALIHSLRVQRAQDESKLKETTNKESKVQLQSKKLPKFLQKQAAKKKPTESATKLSVNEPQTPTIGTGVNEDTTDANDSTGELNQDSGTIIEK